MWFFFQTSVASVLDMSWLDGRFESSGHLLLSLHWPNSLVLWDTAKGTKVWRHTVVLPSHNSILLGFDTDPFDAHRLVFRAGGGGTAAAVFVNDFRINKEPVNVTSFQVNPKHTLEKEQHKTGCLKKANHINFLIF